MECSPEKFFGGDNMEEHKLEARNISKVYPGTIALNDCSITFESGKVNALIGKNGSGKSTLVKIFSGAVQPTSGEIKINNRTVKFETPIEALNCGIATVYQELSLIPGLCVAENILLGRLPKTKSKCIDWSKVYIKAQEILDLMDVTIPLKCLVKDLNVWQQQVVEIAKALSYNPSVLILDEPTSSLAKHETDSLFAALKKLRNNNVIILYITHRLQELNLIADTITVLRDGICVGNISIQDYTHRKIVNMMFGNIEPKQRPDDLAYEDQVVLEVNNLSRAKYFNNISFKLKKGEILGIAGMLGSGRTELLRSIFGADPFDSGQITVNGDILNKSSPMYSKLSGLAFTPENRKEEGLIQTSSVRSNLCMASLKEISNRGVISRSKEAKKVSTQIQDLQIKVPSIKCPVSQLSGGNQQKVVIGNWLNTRPKIMLFDEPTRGIDVNAKQQIFDIIWNQSKKGVSSIFVSSELEELIEVCHRIIIIQQGEIVTEIKADEVSVEELYVLCMGV